jgi:hypothetical protein
MTTVLRAEGWKQPSELQAGFLHSFRDTNFLFAGRGFGKTAVACKKAEILCVMSPGIIVMITEQTSRDIRDILTPTWSKIVTPNTYKVLGSGGDTEIRFHNGSCVWFRSRQAKRLKDDPPFRGPNVGWVIHDELALDRRQDVLEISGMMIRQDEAKYLGTDVITTPKINWLYQTVLGLGIAKPVKTEADRIQLSDDGRSVAFYGKTADNAHNRGLHDRMIGKLDAAAARQELLAEWVAKDGKCWEFVDQPWPIGNRIDAPYDPNRPFMLGVDLGGSDGAYQLYQMERRANPMNGGILENLLVIKAEWTPQQRQPWLTVRDIQEYTSHGSCQRPARIMIGADYRMPGTTGDTAEMMFSKAGWGGVVEMVTGWEASKDVQDQQASYIICNSAGERRFCVADQLESFHPGATRGIVDMLTNDTYPEPGGKDYFRKEKGKGIFHEDSRDAFLYTAVSVYPPSYRPQERWAA